MGRRRGSAVIVWACLSMPLMSKELGMYLALLGGGFFALAYLFLGRRKGQPQPLSWRAVLILTYLWPLRSWATLQSP
jgi:hypothetical protein